MKKIILFILTIIILSNCSSSFGEENQIEIEKKTPVRTKLLNLQNYIKKYNGTGKVISGQQANLMFEVPGRIVEVNVKIGEQVKKGDVIAKLKNDVYKAKFELAKTALNKANRDFKNIQDLYKKNAVSEDQLQQAELGHKNAKADFITAKYAFKNTELVAPFEGTITHINLQEGEVFIPGPYPIPPVILSNLDHLQLEAIVSSKEIIQLENGQKVNMFYSLQNSTHQIEGVVSEVGFMPLTMSNSYKIVVTINNSPINLKLGLMLNFSVEIAHIDSIYMLSNRYILENEEGSFIWMNDNSLAKKINVKTGDLIGHEIVINGELYPGMMVVTDGTRQVKSGTKLKVVQ